MGSSRFPPALFGARFRENAARSLLIPRAYPGKRTPLWQQRLGAACSRSPRTTPLPGNPRDLSGVPADVFDLPAWTSSCAKHSQGDLLVEVETQTASPFASSLLFTTSRPTYEGDTKRPGHRSFAGPRTPARAARPGRAARADRRGSPGRGRGIAPASLTGQGRAADRDGLQQILRRLGDLTAEAEAASPKGYSAASMLENLIVASAARSPR